MGVMDRGWTVGRGHSLGVVSSSGRKAKGPWCPGFTACVRQGAGSNRRWSVHSVASPLPPRVPKLVAAMSDGIRDATATENGEDERGVRSGPRSVGCAVQQFIAEAAGTSSKSAPY
ncbi:hypothetical protein MRX96_056136 [Rhipicephalus microplus]